jgi:hypothetical protein
VRLFERQMPQLRLTLYRFCHFTEDDSNRDGQDEQD